ncbi:thioredoxin fold domain-containing protein [Marinomonas sp. C1424]|uniref:Thiol:disulfide interchange protein n=2 Tax=Marinomonas transparens TaxID=2795388 RepID=A0A934JXT5_9GAMM|nr:thioredoxin fold domain-containing protein [Marinomonas transparens]
MFSRFCSLSLVLSAFLTLFSNVTLADEAQVLSSLKKALPQYEVGSIKFHQASGLYVVEMQAGPTLHMTADGGYFVAGDLYKVNGTQLENETEVAKLAKVEALPEEQMIVFKAAQEKTHITVFTDVDCGYCRMLHNDVPALNEKGITVRYLAFPRAGVGSEAYNKMVSVWCSEDPKAWLTKAKQGESIPENKCVNPVADEFNLGRMVGVRGTPTIILANGSLLPGYLPVDKLAKEAGL